VVGTREDKGVLFVVAVLNAVSGLLHTNTCASVRSVNRRTGESKSRRMQRAFAAHLWQVIREYPAAEYQRVVLIIDKRPVALEQAGRSGASEQPAVGVLPPVQLQPVPARGRAVLEEVPVTHPRVLPRTVEPDNLTGYMNQKDGAPTDVELVTGRRGGP
jgi:hypothetical protein